ncbi:hypothetical protein [Chlamydia felis]|nr:hypothetical protein [Chlamydia felis]
MFSVYITLPTHMHTSEKNTFIFVPGTKISVCKTAYFPELSMRFLVTPLIGLIFTIFLIYRRFTIMRAAYSKLDYTPNKHCEDKLCSRLHPEYYIPLVTTGILGGIGALIPLLVLGIVMCMIMKILKKLCIFI